MHLKLRNLRLFDGRQFMAVLAVVLLFCAIVSTLIGGNRVEAATASTINFQARLMNASGNIADDGNYNIEFKLYNTASSGGTAQGVCTGNCKWVETRVGSDVVTVANGYVTVNLGSVNSFGSTIDWDQDLWLTMNVGGTGGSPSWDGEMTPRLKLTAVPYAFRAAKLASLAGSNTGILEFAASYGQNSTITLPDPGASTATVCYQGATGCGFATGSGSAFLQNGNSFGTTATLGTNDGNDLQLERNNATKLTVGANDLTVASGIDLLLQGANAYISNPQAQTNSESFGSGATVSDTNALALGNGATAQEAQSIAIGRSADANGDDGIAIGYQASVTDDQGIAIGATAAAASDGIAIGYGADASVGGTLDNAIAINSVATASNQLVIGGITLAVIGNGVTNASPTGFTLEGTSGNGTDVAGASVNIAGGQGTGTGNGGSINLQVADPGSTGSSLNSLATALSVSGVNGSVLLQNTTDSTTAFRVLQADGDAILTVDTTGTGGVVLGNSTNPGSLSLFDSTGGQKATIIVGNLAADRQLTIPVATGSDTFCLQTVANCGSGSAVTTVGTIDTPTTSADGAHISANTIYLQTATASVPGLVSTGSQTFAGDKTFTGNVIIQGTTGLTFNTGAGGDITFANSEKIDNDTNGQINLQADSGALTVLLTGTAANITNSAGTLTLNSFNNTLTVDSSDTVLSATGLGTINLANTVALTTGGTTRFTLDNSNNLYLGNGVTAATPNNFAIQGTGSTTTAVAGGSLTIQGGNATVGNANGGNVTLTGGTGFGTGVRGLVVIDTPTLTTTANDANCYTGGALVASSCTIAVSSVNNSAAVLAGFSVTGQVATVPDPTITIAGRILYVTAANGSSDFTLRYNTTTTPIDIAMRANNTATLIWNGSDWTAAGASSSTDLQSAYNNTLTSAGGAEIVLNPSGGTADGLTIRNNATTPIIGGILEVQNSIGSNLLSVNNNATEYAANGGAESTTFTAWTGAPAGGTITRDTATVATGQGSVKVVTTTTPAYGVENQLVSTLTNSLKYSVSYAIKADAGSSGFTALDTMYSYNGTDVRHCVSGTPYYSTGTASQSTTTITGVGTTWTAAMVGKTFYFADGNSAVITAFGSATSLTAGKSQTVGSQNYAIYTEGFTVAKSVWTRVTCTFIAPPSGTTITSSNSVMIRQTDSTTRTYYIDNLSVTVSADVNHAVDGSADVAAHIGGGNNNWAAVSSSTVTQTNSILYDSSGAISVATTAVANRGVYNRLNNNIAPSINTQYRVAFYARGDGTNTATLAVAYTPDNGSTSISCQDYNATTVAAATYTLISCYFTTDATAVTNAQVRITQASGSATTFYVDALTVTLNSNTSSNVQVGGANKGGPTTLLTLDRSGSAPIAANNDAYLGSLYYDTSTGRIQCYEADGWGACGAAPDNYVNLLPEYTGAVLHGSGTGTMTADFCSDTLNVNDGSGGSDTICSTNDTYNYYKWTSPQSTQQTYSIYVTYLLPATFKGFSADDTVKLTARVTSTTNAAVTYEMYRDTGGSGLVQCYSGSAETAVTTSSNTWQTVPINGNEATGCSFSSSSANQKVVFKINLKANSNASAYVSNLSFITTGQ